MDEEDLTFTEEGFTIFLTALYYDMVHDFNKTGSPLSNF